MPREGAVTAPNAPGFSGDLFHDPFHALVGAWSSATSAPRCLTGQAIKARCRYNQVMARAFGTHARDAIW
jgi:hypothetical protein